MAVQRWVTGVGAGTLGAAILCAVVVHPAPLTAQEPVAWRIGEELVFHTFSIAAIDPRTIATSNVLFRSFMARTRIQPDKMRRRWLQC